MKPVNENCQPTHSHTDAIPITVIVRVIPIWRNRLVDRFRKSIPYAWSILPTTNAIPSNEQRVESIHTSHQTTVTLGKWDCLHKFAWARILRFKSSPTVTQRYLILPTTENHTSSIQAKVFRVLMCRGLWSYVVHGQSIVSEHQASWFVLRLWMKSYTEPTPWWRYVGGSL